MFYLDESKMEWVPYEEDPFVFYDRDRDGVSEEVLRLQVADGVLQLLRHSFSADNRGTLEDPRRFDVSLTAFASPDLRGAQAELHKLIDRAKAQNDHYKLADLNLTASQISRAQNDISAALAYLNEALRPRTRLNSRLCAPPLM